MHVPPVGGWQKATVLEVRQETPNAKTFRLALPRPTPYLAGQHLVLRLTAPDGYRAQRSYSIATAPSPADGEEDQRSEVELTIELLPGGEVSSFLHEVVEPGDELEVRGPIGGYFVWAGDGPGDAGRGWVGRRAAGMRCCAWPAAWAGRTGCAWWSRPAARRTCTTPTSWSARRSGPSTPGRRRRITSGPSAASPPTTWRPPSSPTPIAYVCGTTGFADAASDLLMGLGVPAERIRVERFGPTG